MIERFLDALWMERGLSRATLEAYRADLLGFGRWLAPRGLVPERAEAGDLHEYLAHRLQNGARPRSAARLVSTLRRFYRHLAQTGERGDDPSARLPSPGSADRCRHH